MPKNVHVTWRCDRCCKTNIQLNPASTNTYPTGWRYVLGINDTSSLLCDICLQHYYNWIQMSNSYGK